MTPEFDHYAVSRVLGEGGMGLVYLAHDRRTGLPVAIKVMSRREFDPELQSRFLKENRILSGLNHRNIVRCYEITQSREGVLSIVMEYVDGVDFRAFEGRPYPELLPLMIQALMGLAYLRSREVLHRDLSSNNIFVTLENQTRVTKILDFGIAKSLQQSGLEGDVKTRTGQFLGKFAFASPEHFDGSPVDWRSDVYSLGVIFHRLLTKKPPIVVARRSNYYDWLVAHGQDHDLEVAGPDQAPPLPDPLRGIVRRMLARKPDDRPQSYEEIIHVLDRLQRGLPPSLEPDPEALRTLPPAVEGRIGSSGSRPSLTSPAPRSERPAPGTAEPAPFVEASEQQRWPDLEEPRPPRDAGVPRDDEAPREAGRWSDAGRWSEPSPADAPSHTDPPSQTERFVPRTYSREVPEWTPPPPAPEPAPEAPAPEPEERPEGRSGRTELLPPPAAAPPAMDASSAPTVISPISPRAGAGEARPVPRDARMGESASFENPLARLRERSHEDAMPPLTSTPAPAAASFVAAPISEPTLETNLAPPPLPTPVVARPESAPARPPAPPVASAPPAPARQPGQRLVVYGAPAATPAAARAMPAPRATPPAAPAAAPRRGVGIALVALAIVVLFALVLWGLVSLLRASSPASRRTALDRPAAAAKLSPSRIETKERT